MGKLFSFSRSQTIVMLTMAIVLILGAAYLFIYVPGNKRRVEEQRFRCLQNIQTNIKAKRDNSVVLLRSLLLTYMSDKSGYNRKRLSKYIKDYSTDNFKLGQPYGGKMVLKDTDAYPENVIIDLIESNVIIQVSKGEFSIQMKYTASQFFGSLLPLDNFDQYIVMLDSGMVFQTFESGIVRIQSDSLPTRHGAFAKEQVKDVTVGGTQYKLFAQEMEIDKKQLKIIGLLNKRIYQDEKNELPGNVVIFLMILSIATILALPWIKLYQIGGQDRLTAADGMLTFPISMLSISVLFFIMFKYDSKFRPGWNASERVRVTIADKMKRMFESEVFLAYDKLTLMDEKRERLSKQSFLKQSDNLANYSHIETVFKQWNIDEIFWMDEDGGVERSWVNAPENSPRGAFGNRAYFKRIIEDRPMFLQNDLEKPMYLEPVVSRTTGKFVTIISKRSGKKKVVAVAVNLKCMNNPIIPAGISVCIIDERGQVLYHTNSSRNLNENLLSELSETGSLRSAITARTAVLFESKYRGKNYNIYATPFEYLPYHVLVFEDRDLMTARDINVSYFCSFMLTALFLTMIVILLIVFLLSFHTSYFKKHYFDISWVGPDNRFKDAYIITFLWNVFNIIVLVLLYSRISFLEYLSILLAAMSFSVMLLNYQYLLFYKSKGNYKYYFKKHVIIFLCCLILAVNLISWLRLPEFPAYLTIYQLATLVTGFGFLRFIRLITAKKWLFVLSDFSRSFSLMVFSGLIITSGLPIAILFTTSYNQEIELIARYRQRQFAENISRQYPLLSQNNWTRSPYDSLARPNVFNDSVWVKYVDVVDKDSLRSDSSNYPGKPEINKLYHQILGRRSDNDPGLSEFYQNKTGRFRYFYDERFGRTITYQTLPSGDFLRISSAKLRHNSSLNLRGNLRIGPLMWLVFGTLLLLFGAILHRILRKLFALDFPAQEQWEKIDEMIIGNPNLNSLLFVLGAPGSGKMTVLKDIISKGKFEKIKENGKREAIALDDYEILDLLLIPEIINDKEPDPVWSGAVERIINSQKSLIIVNHFEYDIKNPATNHYKLDLLEKLLQLKLHKVIIVSTVHPIQFLDSLINQQTEDKEKMPGVTQSERERWHVLLGHFRIVIQKLETGNFDTEKKYYPGVRVLTDETNRGHFLVKMQKPLQEIFAKDDGLNSEDGSSLAAKIGISSHYFYTHIWQSLTKEEKFLLYDLAEDGLVNPYDDYNITILISKGLIIRKYGLLKLFNEGFRTFILTAIGNSEMMLIRNQIRDSGNWNKLRTPLVVLAVAVLVFLYASQNEAYSEIIKYVGIITVTVPTVYKIFGAMENIFSKNPLADKQKSSS